MPKAPKRVCSRCRRGLFDPATQVCVACGPRPKYNWQEDRERGTRQERGYDKHWLKLRQAKLATHPWCEECERSGKKRMAVEVDHIVPFDGIDDAKRLDWDNLQSMCKTCHEQKTARERR
jgi:5-methylcytosine-specific restriction protein A